MNRIMMLPLKRANADAMVRVVGANSFKLPGADDYECGHCKEIVLKSFDPKPLRSDLAFHCPNCGEFSRLRRY